MLLNITAFRIFVMTVVNIVVTYGKGTQWLNNVNRSPAPSMRVAKTNCKNVNSFSFNFNELEIT